MAYFYELTIAGDTTQQSSLGNVQGWLRGGGLGSLIPTRPSGDFAVSWRKFVVGYDLSVNGEPAIRYQSLDELHAAMRSATECAIESGNTGGLTLSWGEVVELAPGS